MNAGAGHERRSLLGRHSRPALSGVFRCYVSGVTPVAIAVALLVAWLAFIFVVRFVAMPWLALRCGGDPMRGFAATGLRLYCRLFHRARYTGLDELRAEIAPGPLIVVANHGAGLDPVLIQCGCRFHLRWMMSRDMMVPALDWFWKCERIIAVDFDSGDSASVREAMRHVREGGVLGVFPEGGIARPPGRIQRFLPGIGLIVARTEAPVLLCWIGGTPQAETAYGSFIARSRSRVEFVDLIRYPKGTRPSFIVDDLRRRLHEASGWPLADETEERRTTPAMEPRPAPPPKPREQTAVDVVPLAARGESHPRG